MSEGADLVANSAAPLVADDENYDSGIDNPSLASSTQSLTESVLSHVYENGRRYHSKSVGRYFLPTDEQEQDRLDMYHHFMLELLGGKISLAPFDRDPGFVLDCGTGTGIWALDYAEQHPASVVYGIDMAPIQPSYVYPNVRFEIDDLELDWTFRDKFDLIYARLMSTGIKDWPRFFQQMYDFMNPGGYVELSEHDLNGVRSDDGTMPSDTAYNRYLTLLTKCMASNGLNPYLTLTDYTRMLTSAGFEITKTLEFKIPMGGWPKGKKAKYLGLLYAEMSKTGFDAYGKSLLVKEGGLTVEEADQLIRECVELLGERKQHVYYYKWHIVARKPE
ncbi:S-adenosyl-L-methionine-dependent methyltransferase [Ascodesmis nigricans]|uniref:S-adenosyl-L-methionine-dependent methyltransferase n=1 Tax=Ascodesmis nigricans TaxID=341454 RepID=A0A4S2MVT3_9PEZI|nr:S-adenosyl-L-methionine-dependent methyltransferase [Ascodesmis nigricans]